MNEVTLPVLKAWNRIFDLLDSIAEEPYDRSGFEDAVLRLYPGKSAKSVFRGMAIPTLRNLGLIIGYGDVMRISASGAMIQMAHGSSLAQGLRALRCILFEIDEERVGILDAINDATMTRIGVLVDEWIPYVRITDPRVTHKPDARDRAARERIQDWIDFLAFSELLHSDGDHVALDMQRFNQAKIDADSGMGGKKELFRVLFFDSYSALTNRRQKIRTVDIELLRKEVALRAYLDNNALISERQFDALLVALPKTSDSYTISLGRSMGPDEKLFQYRKKYYQSLSIRFEDQSQLASTN